MNLERVLLILCLAMLVYIYAGYPIIVWCWHLFARKRVLKSEFTPFVTVLIPAYNEAPHIEKTIQNKLDQDYPSEKLEIVVVSDGSSDGTDEIVKNYTGQAVKLIRQDPRAGKTAALNLAMPHCSGEIIAFSDANSIYGKDAVRRLVRGFADPSVGYVTGKMVYNTVMDSSVGDGCGAYMRYENFLRHCESGIGSVVGVDGGIDAVRKSLYVQMREDQLPDFVLPLHVITNGYRVIYEPEAVLCEDALVTATDEYRMRVRVTLRALWALWDMRHLLSLRKYGVFAWQLWSHKLLRYCGFVFLIGAYFSNLFLLKDGPFYIGLFILQNLGYLAAIVSYRKKKHQGLWQFLNAFEYFVLINLAAGHAFLKFITGKKQVLWQPRKG